MMAWSQVARARPTKFGGLGITDLEIARCALQLRWLWLKRTDTRRPWHAFPIDCDKNVTVIFNASIQVQIGDGTRPLFWIDPWLEGTSIQLFALELCKAARKRAQNSCTVALALTAKQWIRDITTPLTIEAFIQYMALWIRLQHIQFQPTEDLISWRWSASQQYTAKSAYTMFFAGSMQMDSANLIWKSWAPPKVKLFLYFALNKRTWTAERRKCHGLQNDDTCAMCSQLPEHIDHLMISCTVARQVRWEILGKLGLQSRFDATHQDLLTAWPTARQLLSKDHRKGVDSMIMLIVWHLWKARNRATFEQTTM